MPNITRAARDLQSAANRLDLMVRNHNRDVIIAGLLPDAAKGRAAAARLEAQAPALKAQEDEVRRLRAELGTLLDGVLPARVDPAEHDEIEPPTKRKRSKK